MFRNCTLLIKRQKSHHNPNRSLYLEKIFLVDAINETLIVKIDGKLDKNITTERNNDVIQVDLEINLEEKYFTSVVFEAENNDNCNGTFNH
jgi:hypothetical protein